MQIVDRKQNKHRRRIAGLIHEPKLTWDQVNEIRRAYVLQSRTRGLKALAEQYSVSVNNIHKIVRGKTWRVTEGDGNVPPPLADKVTSQQFSKAMGMLGRSMDHLREELHRLQRA